MQELEQEGQEGHQRQRGAAASSPASLSAQAAKLVLQAVHTFVALTQLQQVSLTATNLVQSPLAA